MRPKRTTYSPENAAQRRARNQSFVDEINRRTVCAHCGSQPIEWHNPEHVELNRQDQRISNLVWQPAAIVTIEAEMARCTPLCRRCHMREDGRAKALQEKQSTRIPSEPRPCAECGRLEKPLRRGLCGRCYDVRRRRANGVQPAGKRSHCRAGHPLTPENTISEGKGVRRCRTCRHAKNREWYARKQDALKSSADCAAIWSERD